jgi:hypothetical protein
MKIPLLNWLSVAGESGYLDSGGRLTSTIKSADITTKRLQSQLLISGVD